MAQCLCQFQRFVETAPPVARASGLGSGRGRAALEALAHRAVPENSGQRPIMHMGVLFLGGHLKRVGGFGFLWVLLDNRHKGHLEKGSHMHSSSNACLQAASRKGLRLGQFLDGDSRVRAQLASNAISLPQRFAKLWPHALHWRLIGQNIGQEHAAYPIWAWSYGSILGHLF